MITRIIMFILFLQEVYFEQLKQICNASEEQLLEKFKNDISNTLDSLIKELKQNPQLLIKIVNQWSKNNPNIKLLLTIDQSEELITLCKNDQDREDFLRLLAETLASPDLSEKLHIVLTLRSDFEPQIRDLNQDKYKQETWQDVWQKGRFIVTPMNREELQQVIEEPAAQRTLFFESPKLVNALIDEVLQMPGALPLLSFTLSKLYLRYLDAEKKYCVDETTGRNDRTITEADYKDIGGVPRSLTNTANDTYTQLEKKEKVNESRIRDVMLRMVAISGGELARRRVPTSELVYPEPKNEQVQRVIDGFLAARLLVKGLDNEGQEYVEPVHDALVRGWGKIKNWLEERQKYASNHSFWQFFTRKSIRQNRLLEEERPLKINLFLQRELTTAANHWQRQKEEANERQAFGFLWDSDPRLEQLKQIQRSQDGWFNALEDRFVTHSLRRKRNNFIRLIGSIVLVSLGIYGTARFGESQATRSSITALIDSSKNALNSNQQLEAFIASVKAGKELEQMNRGIGVGGHIQNMLDSTRWAEIDFKTITTLHQVLAQIQEKNRLEGHSDEVNSVVFCPSNANSEVKSLIATASDDNTVKLWQPNGQLIKTSQTLQHSSPITSVSFSPDCQILASASLNGNIKLWKLDKTQKSENIQVNLKQELSISGLITSVSVSPDGKMIATASFGPTGSDKGQINIWTIEGKRLKTFDGQEYDFRTDNFSRLSFSANSQLIALASLNGIKLWNLETLEGEPLKPINIDDKQVRSVSFSPDGKTLASANRNGQIKLWNLDGTPIREWDSHSEPIYQIIFSPDGKMIASGSDDNLLKLWNLEGTSLETFSGHSGSVTSLSFSKDSQTLFSSSLDGTVKVWDINPHRESLGVKVWKHNQKDKIVARVFLSEPSMSLDNNEPTLAFIDGEGKAYLWDVDSRTWKPLQQKPDERLGRISFSPDKQTFVSVSEDLQNLTLWSRKGKRLTSLLDLIDDEFIVEAHFHPQQNNLLAVASSKTIKLWKLEHNALTFWKELKELKKLGEHETLEAIRFSPNGKYLVSAGQDNIIRLWTFDGQLIDQQKGFGNSKMLRFSPNSKFLAFLDSTDHQEIIKLWNLEQRKDIKTLEGHEQPVSSIRFSQDSKTLASASKDRTIRLWNSQGENLQSFIGNRSAIADVIFHPDDQMLASLSSSSSGNAEIHVINLWSREGEEIGRLEHPQAQEIETIRFSEDGQKIVATGIDSEGLVILWDLDRKHLLKSSCQWLHNYLNNQDNNVQPEERNLCP